MSITCLCTGVFLESADECDGMAAAAARRGADMCVEMDVDNYIHMCAETCIDASIDTCIDMCTHMCLSWVHTHVVWCTGIV